ncbi:methylenetetrahydrofolate reductase [Agrobacterium tumefaciens]|uniref:methylenetetrahydrofolate reductase n=1 Tax=Agrobacterium tumefaciens TaxID=358 RepID=UPI001573F65F|nr:methylenetetrahydrofolate reductase [Agrobacterium tumefaciens]
MSEPRSSSLDQFSIEVLPRFAKEAGNLQEFLPVGTRIYIPHIESASSRDVADAAGRFRTAGFKAMPHVPARAIKNKIELEEMLRTYQGEGVDEALVLAGERTSQAGEFRDSLDLLETGSFERFSFKRLHFAGHPEGNPAVKPGMASVTPDEALARKQAYVEATSIDSAIVTQFVFDAKPVIEWSRHLRFMGIRIPVHMGLAGPAQLGTLIKYAVMCGIGPSLNILKNRAKDVTKLLTTVDPAPLLEEVERYASEGPESAIETIHLFPFGGVMKTAKWVQNYR